MNLSVAQPSRIAIVVVAALAVLASSACNDSKAYRSPSDPLPPPPSGPPPVTDLTGTWSGTLTVTYDPLDADEICTARVEALFTQEAGDVRGTLSDGSECGSREPYSFSGRLRGDVLSGQFGFDRIFWSAVGRVSGDQLTIDALNVRWELRR